VAKRKKRKAAAPLTRGSAKWRIAGIQANLEDAMRTFAKLLTAEEVVQLVGCRDHLDYVLQKWSD
jgi:hypothetical protein